MRVLASMLGGSVAYGLNTPSSDKDERYVFQNTEIDTILGMSKYEDQINQNETEDRVGYELRRYFQLLRKTNSSVMELLFNKNWIELNKDFENFVLNKKERFLDTEYTFKSLCGYIFGEKKLITGDGKTGKLGSKRKNALEQFGYSNRNAVQCLRLIHCAATFFAKQYFPVNIREDAPELADYLMSIKTRPQDHKVEKIIEMIDDGETKMKEVFDTRDKSKDFKFDTDYANCVIFQLYFPILKEFDVPF